MKVSLAGGLKGRYASGSSATKGAAQSYWFVGTVWNKADQMQRFLAEGCWENGSADTFLDVVRRMKAGDRIAMKTSFVRRRRLPFEAGEKPVSVMRIKATGMILENPGDGRRVKVAWYPPFETRDWYFYTYRTMIVQADEESEYARRLIDFTFRGVPQEYAWWLSQPYWVRKHAAYQEGAFAEYLAELPETDLYEDVEEEPVYTLDDIVEEGCFLTSGELEKIYDCWSLKKNLILQGVPGTGKTWLAKRLGLVRVGSKDREITRSRLRVVQFHPSLTYEDFVRGWRPSGDGRLCLVDGAFMQAIQAATSEPDTPFVLVIEEINRGNPAQIFGEMLTLLENNKRAASESIELAYRKDACERVSIPKNLFLIGTMNVADRSLAIVDFALRRRFAFIDLEPSFGSVWRGWCVRHGLEEGTLAKIEARMVALNTAIAEAPSLGPHYRIGHSFVTPDADETIDDTRAWFREKIETEIGPLLDEYWCDAPDTARDERKKLLAPLT